MTLHTCWGFRTGILLSAHSAVGKGFRPLGGARCNEKVWFRNGPVWKTRQIKGRGYEETQTGKEQSGSVRYRLRLHGAELWLRTRNRETTCDHAHPDSV